MTKVLASSPRSRDLIVISRASDGQLDWSCVAHVRPPRGVALSDHPSRRRASLRRNDQKASRASPQRSWNLLTWLPPKIRVCAARG